MSLDLAAKVLGVDLMGYGPRGGLLSRPSGLDDPKWRVEPFHPNIMENGELGLHRFSKPCDTANPGKKNEQSWHRMAAHMLVAGNTNKEIASAAGVCEATISGLRAQRWFQDLCATIANGTGKEILGALKSEALASVEKLVELRSGAESERVQLSAAIAILEHSEGKPVQKILSASVHQSLAPKEEFAELQRELEMLRNRSAA